MLLLLFQLGEARYALDTASVLEIVPRVELRPVLLAQRGVAGLLDYHAAPVPVLDLCELANGRPVQNQFSTRLILVQVPATPGSADAPRVVGLLAERATSLLKRAPSDFTPTRLHTSDTPFLGPVTSDEEGFIHRINLDGLLTGLAGALPPPAGALTP